MSKAFKLLFSLSLLLCLCLCAVGAQAGSAGAYYLGNQYEWTFINGEPTAAEHSDPNELVKLDNGYQLLTPVQLYSDKLWRISWRAALSDQGPQVVMGSTVPHLHPCITISREGLGIDVLSYFAMNIQNALADMSDSPLDGEVHEFVLSNKPMSSGKMRLTLTVDGERVPVNTGTLEKDGMLNCITLNTILGGCVDQPEAGFTGTIEYLRVEEEEQRELPAFTGECASYEQMTCEYDDRLDFAQPGERKTQYVTDNDSVLMLDPDTGCATVIGVGEARVHVLQNGSVLRGYQVKAEKADISLLLVIGQSNAEGYCGIPLNSYRSPAGTVYETYLPSNQAKVWNITPQEIFMENSLTPQGVGRAGMDGGIAAGWRSKTGDKVWIVNMGHGGSGVLTWVKGGANYDEAAMVYGCALDLLESKSEYYTLKHKGYFWLQGCANKTMDEQSYTAAYQSMHESLMEDFGMEFGGIVLVRAAMTANTPADVADNGPRLSQKHMAQDQTPPFDNIYMATEAGDQWLTDATVQAWFSGENLTNNPYYRADLGKICPNPEWPQADMPVPTTILAVHPDIHYRQVGYNELGRLAGEAMGELFK